MSATARTLSEFALPTPCLVLLLGPAGSGKSALTDAFSEDDVLSSDQLRGLVSGSRGNQDATVDAWRHLHSLLQGRMRLKVSTIVDATNAIQWQRAGLIRPAVENGVPVAAIVLDTPLTVAQSRNALRAPERRVPAAVVTEQYDQIIAALPGLRAEGIDHVLTLSQLPLLTTLLRRQSEREAEWAQDEVEGAARAAFGPPLAQLMVWDDQARDRDGVLHGRLALGGGVLQLQHRLGSALPPGGFEARVPRLNGYDGPAWVGVHGVDDLLAAASLQPVAGPRCEGRHHL